MIGCRCRYGNVHSRAVLIVQTLSGEQSPKRSPEDGRRESRAGVTVATRPHPQAPRKPRRGDALESARPSVETTVASSKRKKVRQRTTSTTRTTKCPSSHFRREQMLFSAPYSPVRLQTNPRMRSAAVRTATSHATITAQARKRQSDRTRHSKDVTKAVTARGLHLFPFRTEKLNPATPMVLRKWESR